MTPKARLLSRLNKIAQDAGTDSSGGFLDTIAGYGSSAWDATKGAAGSAWDATKGAASSAWDATKNNAVPLGIGAGIGAGVGGAAALLTAYLLNRKRRGR